MWCLGKDCGRPLHPEDKFCPGCGKETEKTDNIKCDSCKTVLSPASRFCGHCGKRVIHELSSISPQICAGVLEDSTPCQFKLIAGLPFCPRCGARTPTSQVSSSHSAVSASVVIKDVPADVDGKCTKKQNDTVVLEDKGKQSVECTSDRTDADEIQKVCLNTSQFSEHVFASSSATAEICTTSMHGSGACVGSTSPGHLLQDAKLESMKTLSTPVPCSDNHGQGEASSKGRSPQENAEKPDSRQGHFSQYADQPFHDKKTISLQNKDVEALQLSNKVAHAREMQKAMADRKENGETNPTTLNSAVGSTNPEEMKEDGCKSSASTERNKNLTSGEKPDVKNYSQVETRGSSNTSLDDPLKTASHSASKVTEQVKGSDDRHDQTGKCSSTESKKLEKKSKKNTENGTKGKDTAAEVTSEKESGEQPGSSKAPPGTSKPANGKSYAAVTAKGANTRGKSVQNNADKNMLMNTADMVTVTFRVIVSDLWDDMDPAKYNIFLRCKPLALGGFTVTEEKNKMKFVGKVDGIGYLYEGKLSMKKDLRNSGFQYKYIAKEISGKGDRNKPLWELVQRKPPEKIDSSHVNRRFAIPTKSYAHTGDWARYDGVAYFPGAMAETVWNRLKSLVGLRHFHDRVRRDAAQCAEVFLPPAEQIYKASLTSELTSEQSTLEGYLSKIDQVMGGLKQQMLDPADQGSTDNTQVQKAIQEVLLSPLVQKLDNTKSSVVLALFLYLLLEQYSIPVDSQFLQQLCMGMLLSPDMNNTASADMEKLAFHFPTAIADKRGLARKLLDLIDRSDQGSWGQFDSNASWLCCIPLLHFLQEKSHPYQDPEPSPNFRSKEWWGLTGFERRKDSFKRSMTIYRVTDSVIELLKPAFQLDPLFVRTFVACLDLEPLLPVLLTGIVPVSVMAATLSHHLEEKGSLMIDHKKKIGVCLTNMIDLSKKTNQRKDHGLDMKVLQCDAQILQVLHKQLIAKKHMVTEDSILKGSFLAFFALDSLAMHEEKFCQQNNGVQGQSWTHDAKGVSGSTCHWLSGGLRYSSSRFQTLQMWDSLLSKVEGLSHTDFKDAVKKQFAAEFEKSLHLLSAEQKLEVYLTQYKMAPVFADILNRLAFESLDDAFKMESKYLEKDNQSVRLVSLLSAFIERKWSEQVRDKEDVLKFVITWIPMNNYLRKFGEDKSSKSLGEKAAEHIQCAQRCIGQLLDDLKSGSILVRNLQFLTVNCDKFLAIMVATRHEKKTVSALLDLRDHELQTFNRTAAELDGLLEQCRQLLDTDDLPEIQREIEKLQTSANTLPLSAVCEISIPDSVEDFKTYTPRANPWSISEDILQLLPQFAERIQSYIFKKLFSDAAHRSDLSSVQFWRAFQIVWSDVSKEWQSLCTQMTEGTISLAETERVFGMFRTGDGSYRYPEIQRELLKLSTSSSDDWVANRIKQFSCYTSIKKYVKAATMLLNVKKAYNIEGDFGDIKKICSLSQDKRKPVCDVDHSVLGLCKLLEDFTPQGIDCLRGFLEPRCLEFVGWLKNNMRDGMKELHVFVDLAFISAGEEPYAIGRVNCFHAAAVGYSPLIFMEKKKNCRDLLRQCRLVFANVRADPTLPEKLADSSRFLDWFKDVQKSHGSVEKTSLAQVGNINDRGVFRVGKGDKPGTSVSAVIQLKVSEDTDMNKPSSFDAPPRKYSYEELLDLQSRLMLVAGQAEKGKENVDRFITIMESLVRLAKTYVQLCNDGCVLFLDWTVEFLCDIKRPVCSVSEFASQGKLKGHRSTREDLEVFIAGIAAFLEQCHSEWLQYVDQKRRDYPEFNVYTVEQLVFLQQQFIKVGSDEVSKHVYPMLSLLKPDCSPQDLEQALQTAMDHIDSLEHHHQPQQPQQKQKQLQPAPVGDREKVEQFVTEILNCGFSKALALKALKEVNVEDVAEGIAWCMSHEDNQDDSDDEIGEDDGEEEPLSEEEPAEQLVGQRLREWVTRKETITQSAIGWLDKLDKRDKGTTLQSQTGALRNVWQKFLETVSSSGMDFLSLEHLGIVLKCLARQDQRQFERTLPPNFKPRTPNLILCPKNEVLNAVTYMYMFPQEKDSLLPQPDEVLLCTEDTTFEEVDIFLRRTFFGTQQKVHCLAFADYLDYDVGEKAEKRIKEYITVTDNREYHLVVVCTAENEYRARIVAALEKYRRPSPSLSNTSMVRSYLRTQFAGLTTRVGVTSASCVDPESLCVRVVKSSRSGVGKTLYKQRLTARLKQTLPRERRPLSITIPLHGRVASDKDIATCLLQHTLDPNTVLPRIVHLDISYQVLEGVDHLLYNLLVLGCVTDNQGRVWLRSPMDLYLVETLPLVDQKDAQRGHNLVHQIFDVLPSLSCWSPHDSLNIMRNPTAVKGYEKYDCLFDDEEYHSEVYQRPFRYLHELETSGQQSQTGPQGDAAQQKVDCLATLLRYCGVVNPSWSELTHFVCFLNKQLQDFEQSVYCGMATCQDLPGFSVFVLRFLIQMSRDFATRSLKMSEESLAALMPEENEDNGIQQYEMRRTWESSPHPYIFFNPDGHSMTFLGFSIQAQTGNLVDHQTGKVLEQAIMNSQLCQALVLNRVPLTENFDVLPREDRLLRLYRVLGLYDEEIFDNNNQVIDPDDTYELTTDNVKKILAIYMRFRCNIPVIVMGETGCGKTRLVKFLCALQTPGRQDINTMVLVKVHGGTSGEDIIEKVRQAEKRAQANAAAIGHRPVYTVLFFDEANTTEAIGVIKEVMCDGTLDGQQMHLSQNLKMVAACNPYRKHSDELIERLENAGLGYHVDADKTVDKLGRVPMRRLVYRVQPLPQSMLPLVWDFGQLNTRVEELYIRQMVRRYVRNNQLDFLDEEGMDVLCNILMQSQEFMRQLADECSFVSLRDVDRALTVASWFLQQSKKRRVLFDLLDKKLFPDGEEDEAVSESMDSQVSEPEYEEEENDGDMTDMTKAVVLSLGVCYRACLRSKEAYDQHIIVHFKPPFSLPNNLDHFANVISRCQDVFLDNVRLEDNIARNQALKENVFMMVVCIELRIPLFLVGKPGSSKSLAKTIVSDSMQGNNAHYELFRTLKQAQMVSFQCSPLATADGILGTFRQCAQFQKDKNKETFVSVVVLDEVGLAEDSPKMPLKTLHPLLEDGCPGDELPDDSKKVAFIGISNWALDPAKMNRGILVQRDVPDEVELVETARGICTTNDELALLNVKVLIPSLAKAYLNIFQDAKRKREFFGLRDFYSLVKMVYTFAAQSKRQPSQQQLIAAIRRNFGGLDTIDPVESFKKQLPTSLCEEKPHKGDPDCSPSGLIKAALSGDDMGGESRYLLLLTENYGGLSILSENLLADRRVVPIFGSSFPKDQEYTQICRNINRIKVCMEMGQTVILLNLENLYESLYDALNQYYAMLGGERYVDLGLGTHRVKCRVHRQFRLIVVAEKQAVYEKFPIPLINRLEKHFLTLNNIMTAEQMAMARNLEQWAEDFVSTAPAGPMTRLRARNLKKEAVGDVFMGYHPDTAPAIVLKVWDILGVATDPSSTCKVLEECQHMLLWCATPDAVVRSPEKKWSKVYHEEQQHDHLQQYLKQRLVDLSPQGVMLMSQVTTHSKLLTEQERRELSQSLPVTDITLLSLQAFDTEQQFCQQLRLFFSESSEGSKLLVVQCDCGDINQNLIKCAQYCMQDLRPDASSQHHVVFIIQLPRIAGACFTGFLGGNWHCLHIDDLRETELPLPPITLLQSHTPAQLIMASVETEQEESNMAAIDERSEELMQVADGEEPRAQLSEGFEEMEVDVSDVQLEVPTSPESDTIPSDWEMPKLQGFDPEYVRDLFTSGIQAAVALVRDQEDSPKRATHRIAVLLSLLEENQEFCTGLHKLVGGILKEREHHTYEAERWLSREAAKLDSVKKAGTFRRAWMQYMENKVVPVLAGAIAYLDTNHNLDLLACVGDAQDPSRPAWVSQLWLAVLEGVCQLSYRNLRSMSNKEELDEFTVHHTGAGSHLFSARLPFSWLLYEVTETAITGAKNVNVLSAGDILDTAGNVVDQSPIGRCLGKMMKDSEEHLQQMFQLYISDLLCFTFPMSDQQHQMLCTCIEKGLKQLRIKLVQLDVGRGLVALHMLMEQMRPRLQSILDMCCSRPHAVEALSVGAAGPCAELLGVPDEMTEDVALLRLLVEELQPRPSQFNEEQSCLEWMSQYSAVAPVVLRILSDTDGISVPATTAENVSEEDQEEEEDGDGKAVKGLPFGVRCIQQLTVIRCLWTRVATLKLFLDFVRPLRQGPEKLRKALENVKLMLLYKLLGDEADLKKVTSLENVDKFLKHANGNVIRGLLGKVGECSYCQRKFESAPVDLPCKHTLCNSCYRDSCHGNRGDSKCPECDAPVPQGFDPSAAQSRDREAVELLGQYQRQVSGFLMAAVSQLCFAGSQPPETAAVKHLFGYIIHRSKGKMLLQTKHMTVHDDLIDPTPVLRTFLLRLLLKHNEKEVFGYLEEFLKNAKLMADQELTAVPGTAVNPTLLEFSLLIIHCIEDLHHEHEAVVGTNLTRNEHLLSLADSLQALTNTLSTPPPRQLALLYSLGSLRHVLNTCAHLLHDAFAGCEGSPVISEEMENLLFELQRLCTNGSTDWPKKFIVKQLCREYGIKDYMTLLKLSKQFHQLLSWIVIQEPDEKVDEVADRYLVCSEHYKLLRDQIAQLRLSGDNQDLLQMIQNLSLVVEQKEMLLLLALHREITMSVLRPLPDPVRSAMADHTDKFIQDCDSLQNKALAQQLCRNQLGDVGTALRVNQGQDLGTQDVLCLLTHLHLVLRPGSLGSNLLHPLSILAFQPSHMVNSFLPTMPQDNLLEVLAVIREKVWQCPKGHRYLIGECGRPYSEGVCPCGERIGGTNHNPAANNREGTRADQTQTGHILGPALQRGLESVPERQLSAVECAVLRFLTHAALYLAATDSTQVVHVSRMVAPSIPPQQAAPFFLDHVLRDLQVLQRVLGRSADDVLLVLHHVCHIMAWTQAGGNQVFLQSKEERNQWERQFATIFIAPSVKDMETVTQRGNRAIVSDTRQGESMLLKLVHEDEDGREEQQDMQHLQTNTSVWRYRPRITVDHFFRQFHLQVEALKDMKNAFPVLKLLKEQRHIVYALHYVPDILAGQRRLMTHLHRRLDRAEAATLTVQEVMDKNGRIGLDQLLNNFSKAWEMVKEHLIGFQCVAPIEGVMVTLPKDFHNATITSNSPVAVLLPSMYGPGLCSYIFLQFILRKNNDFLQTYSSLLPHRQKMPEVSVRSVTERHLVGCSPERDLLPMVLSHCNYSLMVGQAAKLEYDFAALQQQLQDTLLQCKAFVQRSELGHIPVDTMVYRADTTSSRLFKVLREKIDQECLSPAERRQIVEDLREDLPKICQSIDNLNTALSFLKALGGSPFSSLHDFMTKALKMRRSIFSHKAQQECKLTHVQSLWILLCHQRASILAAHHQDAFDGIEKELREELTPEQGQELEAMCQHMSVERLELLLLQLFECIMLHLSEPRSQDDDTHPENFSLRDVLMTNLESPLYHEEPVEVRSGLLTVGDLASFPQSLQGRHSTTTWVLCRAHLANKRQLLI